MKQTTKILKKYVPIFAGLLIMSCDNDQKTTNNTSENNTPPITSDSSLTIHESDTLLYVNYESGTTDSGIEGIVATKATASDAAGIVSTAATGNYAISHKIIEGNSGYYSNDAYRSESDADQIPTAHYYPGDERRYEVSVLLKDWTPWNTGDPTNETNVFQLKLSGESEVPLQIRTQRNALRLRFASANNVPTVDILADVRPYVNQWIHFRVDVKWANTATGYMKTYMKLPGQNDYALVDNKTNYLTYNDNNTAGQHGYIKWGLYIAPANITRIAYHDDIRIINLNQPPTETGLIWGNSIPDANPAFLDGPYTNTPNILNRSIYNNSTHIYKHPCIKYQTSQNIVYVNSTNPAPNPADNVTGTPWSDFSRSTLTAAGMSGSTPAPGGRYLLTGWANAPSTTTASAFDATEYYEFNLEPKNDYYFNFNDIKFTVLRGNTSHPNQFVLRSSIDNFATNITAPVSISSTTTPVTIAFDASMLTNINTAVTFRLYAYGATATSGNMAVGVNDFQVYGQVLPSF